MTYDHKTWKEVWESDEVPRERKMVITQSPMITYIVSFRKRSRIVEEAKQWGL